MIANKEIIKGETKEEAYRKVKEKYGKEVADIVHIWKWGKNSYLATVDKHTVEHYSPICRKEMKQEK